MRNTLIIAIVFQFLSFYAFSQDSSISFINATKKDDLIILGRVLSHAQVDYSVTVLPKTIVVQVIEVLRGNVSTTEVTIKGADTPNRNDLAILLGYEVGKTYVFSLHNFELNAFGHHTLDFVNNFVIGNISNEPDENYRIKLKMLFGKFEENQKSMHTKSKKQEKIKTDLQRHFQLLNQTMSYDKFKSMLNEVITF